MRHRSLSFTGFILLFLILLISTLLASFAGEPVFGFTTHASEGFALESPQGPAATMVVPMALTLTPTPTQVPTLEPNIVVNPVSLDTTLAVHAATSQTLVVNNVGNAPLSWSIDEKANPAGVSSFQGLNFSPAGLLGEPLFEVEAGLQAGSTVILGVEYASGSFWVTAGGIDDISEPNFLYELDGGGNLKRMISQTTSSLWGWRDLAYDGAFLYASDSDVIEQINPANGNPTGVTIPSPENPARALAYDPASDHFWVANFGSPLSEIDRNGTVINSFVLSPTLTIYGLAWDGLTPGGPYLWAWSQDTLNGSGPKVLATQIDPGTGLPTGVRFQGVNLPGEDLAGGATISQEVWPDRLAFIGMHQADVDTLVGYDLNADTGLCTPANIPWITLSPTSGTIQPGSSQDIEVMIDVSNILFGKFGGNLCVLSNDPDEPLLVVPVNLFVEPLELFLPLVAR